MKLALLGRDIGYTRSPAVHNAVAEVLGIELEFSVVDVTYDRLESAVKQLGGTCDGFFVTKPYKNDVKRFLNSVNTKCGVNFVRCSDMAGFCTDGLGFIAALDRAFADWRKDVHSALVLGAGGAAYAVTEALKAAGKNVYVLNRTLMNAAKLCNALGAEIYLNQPAEMIVNCTSLGLKGEDALAGLCVLPGFAYAYDLIYSGGRTPFLHRCEQAGALVKGGMDMLVFQAIEGDKILIGDIDTEEVFEKVAACIGIKG